MRRSRRIGVLLPIVLGLVAAAITDARASDPAARPIEHLVIEGALLTQDSEAPPPETPPAHPTNVISILHEQSVSSGDAHDFVLEHHSSTEDEIRPRAHTVWNTFDSDATQVVQTDPGDAIEVVVDAGDDFFLSLRIESDEGEISSGLYADGDSWFRINQLIPLDGGAFSLDVEYSVPVNAGVQSARLRVNATSRDEASPFSPMSTDESLGARAGGVAVHWVQYDDSAISAPPYFGDQFSEESVLSHEEALRRVASDRAILESQDSVSDHVSRKDETPRNSRDAREASRTDVSDSSPNSRNRPRSLDGPQRKEPSPIAGSYAGGGTSSKNDDAEAQRPSDTTAPTPSTSHPLGRAQPIEQAKPLGIEATPRTKNRSRPNPIQPTMLLEPPNESPPHSQRAPGATSIAEPHPETAREATEESGRTREHAAFWDDSERLPVTSRPHEFASPSIATPVAGPETPQSERTLGQAVEQAVEQARVRIRNFVRAALEWWEGER